MILSKLGGDVMHGEAHHSCRIALHALQPDLCSVLEQGLRCSAGELVLESLSTVHPWK